MVDHKMNDIEKKFKPICCHVCQRTYKQVKNFQCELCFYTAFRHCGLQRHIENVHEKIKPFACGNCNKKFGRHDSLKSHYKNVHVKVKNFNCD